MNAVNSDFDSGKQAKSISKAIPRQTTVPEETYHRTPHAPKSSSTVIAVTLLQNASVGPIASLIVVVAGVARIIAGQLLFAGSMLSLIFAR